MRGGATLLARRKFARALTDEDRTIILALTTDAAVWVEPSLKVNDCRDKKDNKYPKLAATAGAEIIISSDDDLLVLEFLARDTDHASGRVSRDGVTFPLPNMTQPARMRCRSLSAGSGLQIVMSLMGPTSALPA